MGGGAAVSDLPAVESAPHRGDPGEAGGGRRGRGGPGGTADALGGGGGGGQAVGYGTGRRAGGRTRMVIKIISSAGIYDVY